MIRGLYTAASGLILGLRRQEVVADNLANVDSPGYKGETSAAASFNILLARSIGNEPVPVPLTYQRVLGTVGSGVYQDAREVDMRGGTLNATDEPLDLGIAGPGFFVLDTPEGIRYTRDGHFAMDGAGRLVSSGGFPVLGLDGASIAVEGDALVVRGNGDILVDGELAGTLQIVELEPSRIIRAEGSMFAIAIGAAPEATTAGGETQVRQRMLEQANVEVARIATSMMANQRAFGANQTVFSTIEETLAQTVDDVGRVG